jgi:SEC-C motif-containing protein
MKTLGRNDPCFCGSGKKYKHCCLQKEETQATNDWSGAVPRALRWLMAKYPEALRETLDDGFFGSLNENDYNQLQHHESFQGIRVNALEWLLAEGTITVKGNERRVSEMLLGPRGPLFSAPERQYLERLAAAPLRLYEVVGVTPGKCMSLKDMLLPERQPVLVREKTGSESVAKFDLIAARIVPADDHHVLSGALYSIPRDGGLELIGELRKELDGLALDSPEAKEIVSGIISNYWLKLFLTPFQMPVIVDQITGERIVFITDHYRVRDWTALEQALSREADVDGSRNDGWSRVFTGKDGVQRRSVAVNLSERSDRIEVFYRTQRYADQGRPWFEAIAGRTVEFVSREISDPKETAMNKRPREGSPASGRVQLPTPEVMTEEIEKRIHQLYADWADQPLAALGNRTPREAIKTPEGLERVKYLLHTYERSEARQSKDQRRLPASYDFLWRELGIIP